MDGNQAGSRATRVLAIPSKAQGPGDGQRWCSAQATAAAASSSPLAMARFSPGNAHRTGPSERAVQPLPLGPQQRRVGREDVGKCFVRGQRARSAVRCGRTLAASRRAAVADRADLRSWLARSCMPDSAHSFTPMSEQVRGSTLWRRSSFRVRWPRRQRWPESCICGSTMQS